MKSASRRFAIMIITVILIQGMLPHLVSYAQPAYAPQEAGALTLPAGRVGQSYEYQLRTEGGLPPFTWTVLGSELPPGLSLEASGKLKGIPTAPRREAYSFVIQVADSSQPPQAFAQSFMLMIQAAPLRMVVAPTPLKIVAPVQNESPKYIEVSAKNEPAPKGNRSANSRSARPHSSSFANVSVPIPESVPAASSTADGGAAKNPDTSKVNPPPAVASGQDATKDQKLDVDKPIIDDDTVTGKTEAGASVDLYRNVMNQVDASNPAEADGTFKVKPKSALAKGDVIRVVVTHKDGKTEDTGLVKVAEKPDPPSLDPITVGDKAIKGSKARAKAAIKLTRNDQADQSGTADDKGNFNITLDAAKPAAKGDKFQATQTVNGHESDKSTPATEAKDAAQASTLTVDKVSVGDTRITGKAGLGAKVEFFRTDVNKSEKSGTANTQDGAFIILLDKQISKDDRIWVRQTLKDATQPGDLISVDIAAPELEAPIVDNLLCWTEVIKKSDETVTMSYIRVEGRTTAGKTVQLFFTGSSTAETIAASNDGSFVFNKNVKVTETQPKLESVQVQLKDGDKLSKLSPLTECRDPNSPFLVGLAPFGLVASQQSEQFSQSDPFGGFIVGNVWPLGKINSEWGRKRQSLNLRFQVLMQPEARTAMASQETPTTTPPTPTPPPKTFLSSRKSLDIEGHMWWEYALNPIVSAGPYFAIGGATTLNKNELVGEDVSIGQGQDRKKLDTTQNLITTNDMKKYYEYGMVLDFYSGRKADANLYIQAILAKGWYEALANLDQHGHDTRNRFIGKLRVFPFGLNRDFLNHGTVTPMFGVDLNAGRGQDYPRFFVGMVFNITKFLNKANEALPKP